MGIVERNILIVSLIVLVCSLIWATYYYIKFYGTEHFVCPRCGHSWKPPLIKMIFATNVVEGKIINCPKCGSKEYIEPTKD